MAVPPPPAPSAAGVAGVAAVAQADPLLADNPVDAWAPAMYVPEGQAYEVRGRQGCKEHLFAGCFSRLGLPASQLLPTSGAGPRGLSHGVGAEGASSCLCFLLLLLERPTRSAEPVRLLSMRRGTGVCIRLDIALARVLFNGSGVFV